MTFARAAWVYALAILAALVTSYAPAHADSTEFAKCMDAVDMGASKNMQWNACYELEMARQDKALNAEYKRLQAASASPDVARTLVLGQRAWLGFRTSWCAYESKRNTASSPDISRLSCMVDLTSSQTKLLHDDAG